MDSQARIRKIIEETNCSFDVARAADDEASGDLERAIQIAREKGNVLYSGGRSGLYVEEPPSKKHITQFKNGILIGEGAGGKFYDFSVDDNIRLKHMLEEKTFDASLLGMDGETAEVAYTERLDEEYRDPRAASGDSGGDAFVGEGRRLGSGRREELDIDIPEMLEIAPDGDALFKVMVGNRRVTVRMFRDQTVRDFFDSMERYCSHGLVLSSNDKEIPPTHKISEVANKLVFLSRR